MTPFEAITREIDYLIEHGTRNNIIQDQHKYRDAIKENLDLLYGGEMLDALTTIQYLNLFYTELYKCLYATPSKEPLVGKRLICALNMQMETKYAGENNQYIYDTTNIHKIHC